jgi:hypothetical protein
MSVVVTIRLTDREVWLKFKDYVLHTYGKFHSCLGKEVTEALKQYLESKSGTHTQVLQVSPKIQRELPELKRAISTYVECGGSIPESMLANIIRQTSRVFDYRSIRNRIEALVSVKFITRDWITSPDGKVYRVIGSVSDNP